MKGEKGQALPIVLALLVLGGLIIIPSLSLASASLNAGKIVKENVKGVFAADAGVEHAIWCIKNSTVPPTQLPDVNQMQVAIVDFENLGPYTLAYYGIIVDVSPSEHYDWLAVEGQIVWDGEAEAYKYTITATRLEAYVGGCILTEVGVRLPVGYSYQMGSAAGSSPLDPDPIEQDAAGAYMLPWKFDSNPQSPPYTPEPELTQGEPEATQTFYFTGEGDLVGDYTWLRASRADIGAVGEVTGMLYSITATATRPGDGKIMATVKADVIWDEGTGETRIILWQINPP